MDEPIHPEMSDTSSKLRRPKQRTTFDIYSPQLPTESDLNIDHIDHWNNERSNHSIEQHDRSIGLYCHGCSRRGRDRAMRRENKTFFRTKTWMIKWDKILVPWFMHIPSLKTNYSNYFLRLSLFAGRRRWTHFCMASQRAENTSERWDIVRSLFFRITGHGFTVCDIPIDSSFLT